MKKRVIKTKYSCECDICGKIFTAKYSNTQYCSNACKQKAYRIGYSERKTQENTLELQLLLQKNKDTELQNEKIRLENISMQREIERNAQKLQLIEEDKRRKQQEEEKEQERKARWAQNDLLFQQRIDQQQKETQIAGAMLGKLLDAAFSRKK